MANVVVISGNVVADPDIHYTTDQKTIVKFNLANERRFGKSARTSFVPIVAFGKTAELIGQYVKKGSPVTITGNLNQETWKAQDGSNRSKLSVIANEWEFNGPKPADQSSSQGGNRSRQPSAPRDRGQSQTTSGSAYSDDIPF